MRKTEKTPPFPIRSNIIPLPTMKRISTSLSPQLDSRLLAYAAVATAALAAPALPSAEADIIYNNFGGNPVAIPQTLDGLYVNFVTGTTSGSVVSGWDFDPYTTGGNLTFFTSSAAGNTNQVVGSGSTVSALTAGTFISGASVYATAGIVSTAGTAFRTTQNTAYVGIRFRNEATGALNFGWALLSTTGPTGNPATLISYAYDNTGAGIFAGQTSAVPEPSTYALFGVVAMGALGMRAWRSRKAA